MLATCKSLADELDSLHKLEESYWHLRSRSNELRDGDKKSQYFHHKVNSRQWRNSIKGLTDPSDGVWKTSKLDIERRITAYYQNLFQSSSPSGFEEVVVGLGEVITEDMNEILDAVPTYVEVPCAIFQMHPTKAPGTDGFHALFFQKFWDIVDVGIFCLVKRWWEGLFYMKIINKTCISLIPKCQNPKLLTEYRPISYCNVIYKILFKTMASKLKTILGDIVSENQSAFIPGRLIIDNALLAFETFHSMKRREEGRNNSFALKLDMSKAYDSVE